MPFSTIGSEVCFANQGSVVFQVRSAAVPQNNCCPTPPPPGRWFLSPSFTADVTGSEAPTSFDFSSCSRFPGTGASSVRQINLYLSDILLIRTNISSLFFRSFCTYICQP